MEIEKLKKKRQIFFFKPTLLQAVLFHGVDRLFGREKEKPRISHFLPLCEILAGPQKGLLTRSKEESIMQ